MSSVDKVRVASQEEVKEMQERSRHGKKRSGIAAVVLNLLGQKKVAVVDVNDETKERAHFRRTNIRHSLAKVVGSSEQIYTAIITDKKNPKRHHIFFSFHPFGQSPKKRSRK